MGLPPVQFSGQKNTVATPMPPRFMRHTPLSPANFSFPFAALSPR